MLAARQVLDASAVTTAALHTFLWIRADEAKSPHEVRGVEQLYCAILRISIQVSTEQHSDRRMRVGDRVLSVDHTGQLRGFADYIDNICSHQSVNHNQRDMLKREWRDHVERMGHAGLELLEDVTTFLMRLRRQGLQINGRSWDNPPISDCHEVLLYTRWQKKLKTNKDSQGLGPN